MAKSVKYAIDPTPSSNGTRNPERGSSSLKYAKLALKLKMFVNLVY